MTSYLIYNKYTGELFPSWADNEKQAKKVRKTIYGYNNWEILKIRHKKSAVLQFCSSYLSE